MILIIFVCIVFFEVVGGGLGYCLLLMFVWFFLNVDLFFLILCSVFNRVYIYNMFLVIKINKWF